MLPHVLRHQISPHRHGGLRCRHVSLGSKPPPPQWWAPVLRCVPWLSMGHRDKGRLSCNGMQQGSRVPKTRLHVTKVL
jgi:hypothetical protein